MGYQAKKKKKKERKTPRCAYASPHPLSAFKPDKFHSGPFSVSGPQPVSENLT